ncbi:MAG TPA: ferrous iron transport protein A [Armatimonadetes bacterium]|nr:ferrous iron transport protein A [Armatimonadota bacterium]
MRPLSLMHPGERGEIVGLQGGRGLVSRLNALGLTVGTEIEVVNNAFVGPLIVLVRDSRLVLGRGEANKIIVRPLPPKMPKGK